MSFHRPGSSAARRGRRTIVLLAALLLVALVVAWVRGSGTDVVRPETSTRGSARVEPLVAPNGGSADVRRAAANDGGGIEERSPTTEAVDATPREPIDVLVLDAITFAPVAGAEVRWAHAARLGLRRHPREYGVMYDPAFIDWLVEPVLAPEQSDLTTTDDAGIARIDTRVFPGRVSALHGERSGSIDVGDRVTNPIRVYVTGQRAITIEVVDAAGSLVPGVPVSLRASRVIDRPSLLWFGTTDSSGRVDAEIAKPPRADRGRWDVHAFLEFPLAESVGVPVDLRQPLAAPVRLVLPPCGSVVVGVREEDQRTAHRFSVKLRGTVLGRTPDYERFDWDAYGFPPAVEREHEVLFPFVGLGLDVYAVASRNSGEARATRIGPSVAGEIVRFDLELAGREPEVTGRFVMESGEPLRDRLVQIVFGTEPNSRFRYPLLTDAEGRFRFFASVPERPGMKGWLHAMPIGIGSGEGGSARIRVDAASTDVALDLGDVVVRGPRVVGSGIVVDDVGTPVPWAYVGVFVPTPGVDWSTSWFVRSMPHGDGSFEIRSSIEVARIRVRAMPPGHAPSELLEFEAGERALRLVAARPCKIAGRVIDDYAGVPSRIHVHAIGPGPRIEGRMYSQSRVENGSFVIERLAPGRYDLELRRDVRGMKDELVHRVEGVDVPPAGTAVDARLDAVDIRGKTAMPTPR